LKWFVTEQQLEEACGRYGRVKAVKISLDKVCLILAACRWKWRFVIGNGDD
jgi:hypothetical protein